MATRAPFRRSSERLRAEVLPPAVQHRPASLAGRSCSASTASPRRSRAKKPELGTWARAGGREEIGWESVMTFRRSPSTRTYHRALVEHPRFLTLYDLHLDVDLYHQMSVVSCCPFGGFRRSQAWFLRPRVVVGVVSL